MPHFTRALCAALVVALLCLPRHTTRALVPVMPDCGCNVEAQTNTNPFTMTYPNPSPSEMPRIHDPVIVHSGTNYFLFSTGRGIPIWVSPDRKTWTRQGKVFDAPPAWVASIVPTFKDYYWAPSVTYFAGRWHLYYAVSAFGKNTSAIGLATCTALDPAHPGANWHDEGVIVQSHHGDNYNAIDPGLYYDGAKAYLAFGSFWSGIKQTPINPETGKPTATNPVLTSLATRPNVPNVGGAIEAPFIHKHGAWYYLFVSFDLCCRGVDSTYNVRVGRSKQIAGPYVDKDGVPMLSGGGTPVIAGAERWRGPGHAMILTDNGADYLVHHAYDAEDHGLSKLRVERLAWDVDGWPHPSPAP